MDTAQVDMVRTRNVARGRGDQVFEVLRERIASQALPPGSRLREQDLASEFGVSRARIREAFGALEQRGLIERIPNRGAVVVRLEPSQVFELFDVREVLEALCARLATENAPEGAWDDLIERFGPEMDKAIKRKDFDAYLEGVVEELRQRMIAYANNDLLADMLDLIYDKTRVIQRRVVILPGRAELGLRMHRRLLEAMARRDAKAAEREKRRIIASARTYLERYRRFVL